MFARFIHWGILAIGILMGLSMIGLPITHLAILVSALSVGIGFGLQTIVNNSVAGLILISERAVSLGDIIATPSGQVGRVTMITIRATRIVTPTGQAIIIYDFLLLTALLPTTPWIAEAFERSIRSRSLTALTFARLKKLLKRLRLSSVLY